MCVTRYQEVNAESVNAGGIGGNENTSDWQAAPSSKGIFQFFLGKLLNQNLKIGYLLFLALHPLRTSMIPRVGLIGGKQ